MTAWDSIDFPAAVDPRDRLLRLYTSAPGAFWRSDVDFSLSAAVRMARFAEQAGISGTYYLRARGDQYNLFSVEGEDALWRILEAGHRVGAHVDSKGRLPETAVERDLRLLDEAFPDVFTDRLVSFHMPGPDVLWRDFHGFENAYAAEWENHYVSDSRGEWDTNCELFVAACAAGDQRVQVNLHAEHWFGA